MKRTRRTLPGTLAPGDAYAPSMFPEDAPAPPAPLALFALDPTPGPMATTPAPCPVCTGTDHAGTACPRGAALDLFETAPEPIDPGPLFGTLPGDDFHEYTPGTDAAYQGNGR